MLIDSIKEVEALFIQSVWERNRLAYKYSDEHPQVIALNNYIQNLSLTLQRTSIYYYDSIRINSTSENYLDYKKTIEVDIKNIKKDIERFGETNSMELEDYFAGKLKIARCFKNLFSESFRTFKIKNHQYEELCALYDFGYFEGTYVPYCPVLPDLGQLTIHDWTRGYIKYLNEEEEGMPISMLNPNDYIPVLPPKPITIESIPEEVLFSEDLKVQEEAQVEEPLEIEDAQQIQDIDSFIPEEKNLEEANFASKPRNFYTSEEFSKVFYGEDDIKEK